MTKLTTFLICLLAVGCEAKGQRPDTVWIPKYVTASIDVSGKYDISIDTAAFNKALYDTIQKQREEIAHLKRLVAIYEFRNWAIDNKGSKNEKIYNEFLNRINAK